MRTIFALPANMAEKEMMLARNGRNELWRRVDQPEADAVTTTADAEEATKPAVACPMTYELNV